MRIILTILMTLMTLPLLAMSYSLRPGLLATVLREIEQSDADRVTFDGEVYSSELEGLKKLPRCVTDLDLSQLEIKGGVCELPPFALFATNVRVLRLPESLTSIGEGAFSETPLESLIIPSSVINIGPRAFYNCKQLKGVNMSDPKVSKLADECFTGCTALEELWLPASLTEIGERALMRTAVKSLVIPAVNKIGRYALAEMPQLTSLSLRNGVEMEEGALFNTPNLQALAEMSLGSPALGFAMSGNAADGKIIDDEIIREGAFAGVNISSIRLGKSVAAIEPHAFRNVSGLATVDVTAKGEDVPTLNEDSFSGVDVSKIRLRVIDGSEEIWRAAPVWRDFIIEGSSDVKESLTEATVITIEGANGMVNVTADSPLEYVGIYSLSGMVLFEHNGCGETLRAGPFDDKEVIVRAITGNVTKVTALLL